MKNTSYIALGLMSGTSLDGVDAAFLETDGSQILRLGPSLCLDYSRADRTLLQDATQAALRWQFNGPQPNSFAAAEAVIHTAHIAAVQAIYAAYPDWASDVAMIGFHGQTVLHHPTTDKAGRTLQLGDGQALANALGMPVYYDFRSADVAAGGQGAPLAPAYHQALAAASDITLPAAVLNLGGVGNVTLIMPNRTIIASDTGPGNGPLDSWMEHCGLGSFDLDGTRAMAGTPDFARVKTWLDRPFFKRAVPRSADRYDFDVLPDMDGLTPQDGAASLAAFTALSVAETLRHMPAVPDSVVVCGGGRYNRAILLMLNEHIAGHIKTAEELGWDSDGIEAQAFAYLAVRSKLGLPLSYPLTTAVPVPMTGGRLAMPHKLPK